MKNLMGAAALLLVQAATTQFSQAAEPDGLVLAPGFHASVVNDGVGQGARHITVSANGDLYISTNADNDGPKMGIIALHPSSDHKAATIEHFGAVDNGTGIRFYKGALYAASPTTIYRFSFADHELVPAAVPEVVVDGMPTAGFPSRSLVFDGKGGLFVSLGASGNICVDETASKGSGPVGLKPCPALTGRSGIWRFDAEKTGQKFPTDGEQIATGLRDMQAMDWSRDMNGLYGVMQNRNGTARLLANKVSNSADDDHVAEEMHRIDKGADLGWPYTYYDGYLNVRVLAPEYGGDGRTPAQGNYSTPVVAFPSHQSPLDLVFYDGRQFPKRFRGGAFVVFRGGAGPELATGYRGYDVQFVPFDKAGKPGAPQNFIEGFAGHDPSYKNPGKAMYRPTGAAVGPDGSLYVVDQNKGRVWRISYNGGIDKLTP